MARFDFHRFFNLTEDERSYDIFSAPVRSIRKIPSNGIVTVTAKWEYNLPGLAHSYLGDKGLWWAILMHNGLSDPLRDIKPGVQLRIPDKGPLLALLESRRTSDARGSQVFTRV